MKNSVPPRRLAVGAKQKPQTQMQQNLLGTAFTEAAPKTRTSNKTLDRTLSFTTLN